MSYRLGVDVGGTFTDLALYDADLDRVVFGKTPSDPADQTVGVLRGLHRIIEEHRVAPEKILLFIHGTTVAINALLERGGARTALVTTAGFRDILHIGRQDRPRLYDWRVRRPEPLVPRRLRFEVRERTLHTGEVLEPLGREDVEAVVERIRAADVEAVAVCLLHSYANPAHEIAVGEALRSALPGVSVALSSQVLPEFKEYDRMSTTTINAYVAPVMGRYLRGLQEGVRGAGISSQVHVMQSNGGIMGAETAAERPVQTLLSGPAAGVIGGIALARQAGEPNAISMDMGGTSFDVSLAYEGSTQRTQEGEVEGFPVKVPMVDIHTLGAGGGSIAWIDAGGALRVGPSSAGAVPGPACYGAGGEEPTVTDANLLLGRLGESSFLNGEMAVDIDLARKAVSDRIAVPLGMSIEEAAEGIVRVVNAAMLKGIRVVSVARGYDPREFCLLAFGGAGPLHAAEVAAELGAPRVLVPIAPGVTSALGLLMADFRHDYVRTVLRLADQLSAEALARWHADMEAEAVEQLRREGLAAEGVSFQRVADLRYLGQGFELGIPLGTGGQHVDSPSAVVERFHDAHRGRYGYASADSPVEVVNLRLTAVSGLGRPGMSAAGASSASGLTDARKGERPAYFHGRSVAAAVYDRARLGPGHVIHGPAIVEQLDSTTAVWPGQQARVDSYGNLLLEGRPS